MVFGKKKKTITPKDESVKSVIPESAITREDITEVPEIEPAPVVQPIKETIEELKEKIRLAEEELAAEKEEVEELEEAEEELTEEMVKNAIANLDQRLERLESLIEVIKQI